MPNKTAFMYYYMRKDNWLYNYQFENGLFKAIIGIERRIKPTINLEAFKLIFNKYREQYLYEFDEFFSDILIKSKAILDQKQTC